MLPQQQIQVEKKVRKGSVMTDLILSEESKQYQDLARDFSQNELAPRAESFDHSGELPKEVWKKAWEIGLVNVRVPEDFGGLGLGLLDACIIAEELGAGCAGISAAFWGNDLAVAPILVAGTQAQKEKYLAPLLSGFSLAGYCFGESAKIVTKRDGNSYTIDGEAVCINATDAAWILIVIERDNAALIIERDHPSLKRLEPSARLGLKAADLQTVRFDKLKVPADNVIPLEKASSVRTVTAPVMAAYATGIARAAMQHAIKYSKERFTFGVPIANHQAVGFMLADMAKNIEAARLLTHKAAWMVDQSEGSFSQSITARQFAAEMAMTSATDAVQVYGGYGYSREYPVEKLMRDAKMLQVLEGNSLRDKLECGRELLTQHQR